MSFISGFPSGGTGGGSGTGEEAVEFGKVEEVWGLANVYSPWYRIATTPLGYTYATVKSGTLRMIGPDGSIIHEISVESSGTYYGAYDVAVDASNNAYVVGWAALYKFDANGVQIWRHMRDTTYAISKPSVDTSENVYLIDGYLIRKINSSGSSVWSVDLRNSADLYYGTNGFTSDAAGNTYFGANDDKLIKYNADGVRIMSVRTRHRTDSDARITFDATENIYVAAGYKPSSLDKYDPKGTYVWTFYATKPLTTVAVDTSGSVYATGYIFTRPNTYGDGNIFKFSPNGAKIWSFELDPNCNMAVNLEMDLQGSFYISCYDGSIRKLSNPAAGKLYTDSNAYDINWIQKTDVPNQYLISYR